LPKFPLPNRIRYLFPYIINYLLHRNSLISNGLKRNSLTLPNCSHITDSSTPAKAKIQVQIQTATFSLGAICQLASDDLRQEPGQDKLSQVKADSAKATTYNSTTG